MHAICEPVVPDKSEAPAAGSGLRDRLAGTNVNQDTFLATDYLNHFNEIVMLLEMVPDMPEILDEAKEWQPKSYAAHFRDSGLSDAELTIEAYDNAPPEFRDPFDETVEKMEAVVARGIERIEAGGVRTEDGHLHELDVLVLATGFDGHRFMRPMQVIGRDGLTLDHAWQDATQAYRSVALPGFPNFFMLVGPNSPIGNFSLIEISEIQLAYIMQLIELYRDGGFRAIAPRPDATRRFNEAIMEAMKGTVWVTGCRSWYLDKNGNPAMWPWSFERFCAEMDQPDLNEFELVA